MLQRLVGSAQGEGARILRFLAVGTLNTAFGYSVYLLGLWLGLAPVAALAVATLTSAIFNYLSIGALVFRARSMVKIPAFTVAYTIIYVFNAVLLHALIAVHVIPWLAQFLVLPPVVAANYGLMRMWVFRSTQ